MISARHAACGSAAYSTYPTPAPAINAGVENVQNHIYFNPSAMPVQHGGSVQVVSATLEQSLRAGILNWDNRLIYQKSSNQAVIPLPELTVYSNLYLLFKVARYSTCSSASTATTTPPTTPWATNRPR